MELRKLENGLPSVVVLVVVPWLWVVAFVRPRPSLLVVVLLVKVIVVLLVVVLWVVLRIPQRRFVSYPTDRFYEVNWTIVQMWLATAEVTWVVMPVFALFDVRRCFELVFIRALFQQLDDVGLVHLVFLIPIFFVYVSFTLLLIHHFIHLGYLVDLFLGLGYSVLFLAFFLFV